MLQEIGTHAPRAVVMAFGQDAADYRVELYPDYHADRRELEADEDIERQFEAAPDLFAAFGWESVSVPGSRPTTCWGRMRTPNVRRAGAR